MTSAKLLNSFHQLTLTSLLVLSALGCTNAPASSNAPANAVTDTQTDNAPAAIADPTEPSPQQATAPEKQSEKQTPASTRPNIADGYYSMGGTGQGLEVRGSQYRYYDEEGEQEWRPLGELTALGSGHVSDGANYWCSADRVPAGGGVCTANGWQAYSSIGKISARELFLGGVESGATAAEVIDVLGQPDQIDPVSPFSAAYIYRGLSVSFYEDAALNIRSVSSSYCTPSGLCPGDAVSVAERLYGAPLVDPRPDADYWQYAAPEAACTMELEVANETVNAIALICQI